MTAADSLIPGADGPREAVTPNGLRVRGGEGSVYFVWEELREAAAELGGVAAVLDEVGIRARSQRWEAEGRLSWDQRPSTEGGRLLMSLYRFDRELGAALGDCRRLEEAVRRSTRSYEEMELEAARLFPLEVAGRIAEASVRGSVSAGLVEGGLRHADRAGGALPTGGLLGGLVGQVTMAAGLRQRQRPVTALASRTIAETRKSTQGASITYLTEGIERAKEEAHAFEARGNSAILVEAWSGADGERTMVVYLPGSADLTDLTSNNPNGIIGIADALYGRSEAMRSGVEEALAAAGHTPGTRVVIAGHSQGGMHAANLAADPEFVSRYGVQGLYTVGAPTGAVRLDPQVRALHVEHSGDVVPGLEGGRNEATGRRATVVAPVEWPDSKNAEHGGMPAEHALSSYRATAELIDRERADPALSGPVGRLEELVGDRRRSGGGEKRTLTLVEVGQDRGAPPPHSTWSWGPRK